MQFGLPESTEEVIQKEWFPTAPDLKLLYSRKQNKQTKIQNIRKFLFNTLHGYILKLLKWLSDVRNYKSWE